MKTVEEKLIDVEQRLKHEQSRRMFERYQTVRLHLLGQDNAQIAVNIGRKESAVDTYLRHYLKRIKGHLESKGYNEYELGFRDKNYLTHEYSFENFKASFSG
ncbi:hypothetical protein G9U52_34070 [Paenibacillus sp. S3N08]|uniref:Uncharacterized protein n=1 Tax=Paenibacillus agricola TaxID=2716264 RepID=A0ABX0JG66_9BACL|nr:hypothetical protein [Paenibacillus agricola]